MLTTMDKGLSLTFISSTTMNHKSVFNTDTPFSVSTENNPVPLNLTSTGPTDNNSVRTTTIVLYGILLVVGVLGNSLVVFRVVRDRTLQCPTFIVMASLAIADSLFLSWRVPMSVVQLHTPNWEYGDTLCKFSYMFYQLFTNAAAYHLVLLAGVRYYTLVHPFAALEHLTNKVAVVMCFILWTVVGCCILPLLVTSGTAEVTVLSTKYIACVPNPVDPWNSIRIYSLCSSVFSYCVPFVVLTVFHAIKAKAVAEASRNVHDRRTRQMSSMVVLVLLLFGGLLLPVHLKNILQIAGFINTQQPYMDLAFRILAYSNSCINPIVYAFSSRLFRKSLRRMCPCWKSAVVSPE